MSPSRDDPAFWQAELDAARSGDGAAVGRILEACRPYLLMVANEAVGPEFRAKCGPSDLVQETFCDAHRDFARFTGRTEADLRVWLRRILLNNAADLARRFTQDKRHFGREVALAEGQPGDLTDPDSTPSTRAAHQEQDEALDRALQRLPDDYRQAIELRVRDGLPFAEVGRALGRSADAARMLWFRAVERLRDEMNAHEPG